MRSARASLRHLVEKQSRQLWCRRRRGLHQDRRDPNARGQSDRSDKAAIGPRRRAIPEFLPAQHRLGEHALAFASSSPTPVLLSSDRFLKEISMSWTDQRVSTLKQLWSDGRSAAEIASLLGNVTRNAVIGKVHRLNLPDRPIGRRVVPRKTRGRRNPIAPTPRPPRLPIPELAPAPKVPPRIGELEPHHCCWPEGNPRQRSDFHFCGRPRAPHTSYCPHHSAKAYSPQRRPPLASTAPTPCISRTPRECG